MKQQYLCILVLIGFLALHNNTCGQENNNCGLEYSKKSMENLIMADSMQAMGSSKSISYLKKAIKEDSSNIEAVYKLALIYYTKFKLSQYDIELASYTNFYSGKAEEGLLECIDICKEYNEYLAFYYLGELYMYKLEYNLAGYFLNEFLQKNNTPSQLRNIANKHYEKYLQWKNWQNNDFNDTVIPLANVNTANSENKAQVSRDGQLLLYMRNYNKPLKNSIFSETVNELFYSYVIGIDSLNHWIYSEGVNLFQQNDTTIQSYSLSTEKNELYFSVCRTIRKNNTIIEDCDIYKTVFNGEYWEPAIKEDAPINLGQTNDTDPCISADGKTLYFTSNRSNGLGGLDLYYSKKNEDDSWDIPVNLGETINTINDEVSPFIHYDNHTLYFSSNGHFGIGGFDMFMSSKNDTGWIKPINFGKPFNDENDNMSISSDARGITGYFDNKHFPGYGNYDIYSIDIPASLRCNPKMLVNVRISTENENDLPNEIEIEDIYSNNRIKLKKSTYSGFYSAIVEVNKATYILRINNSNYTYANSLIKTNNQNTAYVHIQLSPIKNHAQFIINNLQFKGESNQLNSLSKIVLTDFSDYLRQNTNQHIKIIAKYYSISQGENAKKMAEAKAKEIYTQLIKSGVDQNRLMIDYEDLFIYRKDEKMEQKNILEKSDFVFEVVLK